jgi:hypothetical protein
MPALRPSPERVPEGHSHFPIRRTRLDMTVIVCPSFGMAAWIARLISIEGLTSVQWRESFSCVKTSDSVGASGAAGGSTRFASVMKM